MVFWCYAVRGVVNVCVLLLGRWHCSFLESWNDRKLICAIIIDRKRLCAIVVERRRLCVFELDPMFNR